MAADRLGSAGRGCGPGDQSVLSAQPLSFLGTCAREDHGYGFYDQGRTGMVPVRHARVRPQLLRGAGSYAGRVSGLRLERSQTRRAPVVFSNLVHSVAANDRALETLCRILSAVRDSVR